MSGEVVVLLILLLLAVVALVVVSVVLATRKKRGSPGPGGKTGSVGAVGPAGSGSPLYAHYMGFPLVISSANPPIPEDGDVTNPWGIAFVPPDNGPGGDVAWIANNGSGTLKRYDYSFVPNPSPTGNFPYPVFPFLTLLDTVLTPDVNPKLTGVVARDAGATGFLISSGSATGPALMIAVGENGKFYGYNAALNPTGAFISVDNSPSGANYKGCEILGDRFYATNFARGHVEAYDPQWRLVNTFTDPDQDLIVVDGFTTYNVRAFDGLLFVTFAFQTGEGDATPGLGNGLIDMFLPDGTFVSRFAGLGYLNSPWGMTKLPAFQTLSGQDELIVSNFGDGKSLRFAFADGAFFGFLSDLHVNAQQNVGLWDVVRVPKASATGIAQILITQGVVDEDEGLVQALLQVPGLP